MPPSISRSRTPPRLSRRRDLYIETQKRDCRSAAVSFLREGKASPFGRGVTEGDGEGKPGKIEPLCSDKQTFCQSEPSPRSKFFYQRPCPLRRFAPALPKGEPFKMKGVFAIYPKNLSKFWKINLKAFSHKSGKLCYNHNYGRGRGCAALTENNEEGGEPYGTVPLQALWCDQKRR